MGAGHGGVVLEAVAADVMHERGEAWDLHDSLGAEGVEGIVGEVAVAYVSSDAAGEIVGGDAAEGDGASGCAAGEGSYCVGLAEYGAEDGSGADADVGQEVFGPVAAVEEDALVGIVAVVVVPVDERSGTA